MKLRQPVAYILVAGINTLFGYLVGAGLISLTAQQLTTPVAIILACIVAISFSFVTYKLFVFRTQGNWLREYLRSYVVYGASMAISGGILWVLLDVVHLNVWIAQALVTLGVAVSSYIGHSQFTFANPAANRRGQ